MTGGGLEPGADEPPLWDDALNEPLDRHGRSEMRGHLASRAQAERWHAAGHDHFDHMDRYLAFLTAWENAPDEEAADDMCLAWYRGEIARAERAGLSDDPDFWRLRTAPKYYEWGDDWFVTLSSGQGDAQEQMRGSDGPEDGAQ